jgi:L-arabinokinase
VIAAYVSGHGYGHSTRVGEVLRAVREREPGLPIAVVASAPEELFRAAVPGSFTFRSRECDVGVAQRGALVLDERETLERWRGFRARWGRLVAEEGSWLRSSGARLVLGDIPPLAFAAAEAAGLPSVGLANFSWDWIYRHLAAREPGLASAADEAADGYSGCDLLLRLPFAGDLGAFAVIEDIPLVARRPRVGRGECRARLRLGEGPVVLWSFGGIALAGFSPRVLEPLRELQFVVPDDGPMLPPNVRAVTRTILAEAGLGYEDLVGAADVVVTKPGYGIVTDAIGARARLVYTDRGDFPEYPILVREMSRYLPCAYVSNEQLLAGRIGEAIASVLDAPLPPAPDLTGAAVAAARLLGYRS